LRDGSIPECEKHRKPNTHKNGKGGGLQGSATAETRKNENSPSPPNSRKEVPPNGRGNGKRASLGRGSRTAPGGSRKGGGGGEILSLGDWGEKRKLGIARLYCVLALSDHAGATVSLEGWIQNKEKTKGEGLFACTT